MESSECSQHREAGEAALADEFAEHREAGEAALAAEFTPEWFDTSSAAWRSNKKRVGESWSYVCSHDLCKRIVPAGLFGDDKCVRHMAPLPATKAFPSSKRASKPTLQATLPQRRSARLVCPEGPKGPKGTQNAQMTKPPSSQETSPATRFSPRLHKLLSPPVLTGQGATHTASRMRPVTQSR